MGIHRVLVERRHLCQPDHPLPFGKRPRHPSRLHQPIEHVPTGTPRADDAEQVGAVGLRPIRCRVDRTETPTGPGPGSRPLWSWPQPPWQAPPTLRSAPTGRASAHDDLAWRQPPTARSPPPGRTEWEPSSVAAPGGRRRGRRGTGRSPPPAGRNRSHDPTAPLRSVAKTSLGRSETAWRAFRTARRTSRASSSPDTGSGPGWPVRTARRRSQSAV